MNSIGFSIDEEKMFVIANSLEHLFDFILAEIKNPNNKLSNSENHLYDILRELKNSNAYNASPWPHPVTFKLLKRKRKNMKMETLINDTFIKTIVTFL